MVVPTSPYFWSVWLGAARSVHTGCATGSVWRTFQSSLFSLTMCSRTAIIQTAARHSEEAIVVNTKQQLRKLGTGLVTPYTRQNFEQQARLTLETLHDIGSRNNWHANTVINLCNWKINKTIQPITANGHSRRGKMTAGKKHAIIRNWFLFILSLNEHDYAKKTAGTKRFNLKQIIRIRW